MTTKAPLQSLFQRPWVEWLLAFGTQFGDRREVAQKSLYFLTIGAYFRRLSDLGKYGQLL